MATATVAYLTVVAISIATVAAADTKYTNHTVGGDAGWFFNVTTNTSSANYSSWAATVTFQLGDFLLFNTNMDQTVIQTYNETTYHSCSVDDALDSDTFQYDGGSNQVGAATIPVPLTVEGANYFFSSASEGVQCQKGMAFEITVSHGLGLPPSLNQPPPPPYVAPPTPSDDQSPQVTVDPAGDGMRTGASLRWVISALLFGGGILFGVRIPCPTISVSLPCLSCKWLTPVHL